MNDKTGEAQPSWMTEGWSYAKWANAVAAEADVLLARVLEDHHVIRAAKRKWL